MFIHGGYWQKLDRSFFSYAARGLNLRGVSVAVPSYDLCPAVTVGDIIGQMRSAARELARLGRPLVASGHSAGGHLSACLLATDWPEISPELPADLVTSAYAISGVFDLEPLIATSMNTALQLDAATAHALSPLRWPAPRRGLLDAVVGGAESSEFLRQSRQMADTWGSAGLATRYEALPDANHFTVVLPLARSRFSDDGAAGGTGGAGRAVTASAFPYVLRHARTWSATRRSRVAGAIHVFTAPPQVRRHARP